MSIDWVKLEECLYGLCFDEIGRFAREHADEMYYGFALDCNSDYGEVLLCLNTPEDLRRTAVQYSVKPPNYDAFEQISRRMAERTGRPYVPTPLKSADENERELRWSLGDWEHQGFNGKAFDKAWRRHQSAIADACLEEDEDERTFMKPTQDRFTRVACRVAIRLERAGAFDGLRRTDDFRVWVADHDESDDESWGRLDAVRAETGDA